MPDYRKQNYSKFGRKASDGDMLRARRFHESRSAKAQGIDNGMSANITPYFSVWITDPARFDIAGVDTLRMNKKKKGVAVFDF